MELIIKYLIYFLRIFLACICGGAVGYERKNRGKGAGIRTHSIVAIASALMMIISKYGFVDMVNYGAMKSTDGARIAAQVVSGVGFLGAGMIYFNRQAVKGLTTAAGVWATAGIGLALGAGMYAMGIFTTLLIISFQIVLHKNAKVLHMPTGEIITIEIDDTPESMEFLQHMFEKFEITVNGTNFKRLENDRLSLEFSVYIPADVDYNELLEIFRENKNIYALDI